MYLRITKALDCYKDGLSGLRKKKKREKKNPGQLMSTALQYK